MKAVVAAFNQEKALVVVAAFNQEKALVGAFSVITNLRMEHFEALVCNMYTNSEVQRVESIIGKQIPCVKEMVA